MTENLEIIRSTYTGSSEEKGRKLRSVLAENASWTEAAGFPYAGTYIGAEQITEKVFKRLATEWNDYQAKVDTFLADGDQVAAFGTYSGTYKASNKYFEATFVHLYTLKNGKIIKMQQYVDSALVVNAMTG